MDQAHALHFESSYARLPALFHRAMALSPSPAPEWIARNEKLAQSLGIDLDWLRSVAALKALAGNEPLPGATPLAMAYSGHQFGGWAPLLGDGRALLAGEWQAPDGTLYDLHLKGSGPTPFSRNGDGRAALGPMLREYIISEAMAGLGIPTTRSLAVIATGDAVYRQTKEPGGVLTRVARSHVRVGTFQFAAVNGAPADLIALADREMARNFAEIAGDDRYRQFLAAVIARQASLIAHWTSMGFIHGVMNTDNMQLAGETIDYGPCAFMDEFHPQKVFSSIDQFGRYAWDKQPAMALWNLTRLAESLLQLLSHDQDAAVDIAKFELAEFMPAFERHFEARMRAKLGLQDSREDDGTFIAHVFTAMMNGKADFTLVFRRLTQLAEGAHETAFLKLFEDRSAGKELLNNWRQRTAGDPDAAIMRTANPVRIARNHRVEEAIRSAYAGDLLPFNRLIAGLQSPYTDEIAFEDLELAPSQDELVSRTFCGT